METKKIEIKRDQKSGDKYVYLHLYINDHLICSKVVDEHNPELSVMKKLIAISKIEPKPDEVLFEDGDFKIIKSFQHGYDFNYLKLIKGDKKIDFDIVHDKESEDNCVKDFKRQIEKLKLPQQENEGREEVIYSEIF